LILESGRCLSQIPWHQNFLVLAGFPGFYPEKIQLALCQNFEFAL
jgi:hypothetical protein